MQLFHQIDPITTELLCLAEFRDADAYHYLKEQEDDWIMLDAWRKSYPDVKVLLSELKLFRRWMKLERRFKQTHLRAESLRSVN